MPPTRSVPDHAFEPAEGTTYCSREFVEVPNAELRGDGTGDPVHARNAVRGPHDTAGNPATLVGDRWRVEVPDIGLPDVYVVE